MLICIGGRGWYQEEGKEAVELTPGKVVNISAGIKHWHGATADFWMSHLAFEIPGEGVKRRIESGGYCKLISAISPLERRSLFANSMILTV